MSPLTENDLTFLSHFVKEISQIPRSPLVWYQDLWVSFVFFKRKHNIVEVWTAGGTKDDIHSENL